MSREIRMKLLPYLIFHLCRQPLPVNHEETTMDMFKDVKHLHEKFGMMVGNHPRHLTRRKLTERCEFILEELNEFAEACGLEFAESKGRITVGENGLDDQDLAAQADALVDIVYVALGTAVQLGLPWEKLWADVQRANMAKERGVSKRGHAVDLIKPQGWKGPDGEAILVAAGYHRDAFLRADANTVSEELCDDDM